MWWQWDEWRRTGQAGRRLWSCMERVRGRKPAVSEGAGKRRCVSAYVNVCVCVCVRQSATHLQRRLSLSCSTTERGLLLSERGRERRDTCAFLCVKRVCLCKIEMYVREHMFVCVSMGEKSGITQVVGMLSHYGRHPSNEDKKQVPWKNSNLYPKAGISLGLDSPLPHPSTGQTNKETKGNALAAACHLQISIPIWSTEVNLMYSGHTTVRVSTSINTYVCDFLPLTLPQCACVSAVE